MSAAERLPRRSLSFPSLPHRPTTLPPDAAANHSTADADAANTASADSTTSAASTPLLLVAHPVNPLLVHMLRIQTMHLGTNTGTCASATATSGTLPMGLCLPAMTAMEIRGCCRC
mmetsp:Transcript_4796/g.10665  ORF Transcript_4796/g.10665 Transcript_4796/m.10665 type:complete len:116 (-) Transcript_4796:87-434(-)